jgi:hypothetical protein
VFRRSARATGLKDFHSHDTPTPSATVGKLVAFRAVRVDGGAKSLDPWCSVR